MIFFLNFGEPRIGAGSEKSGWTGLSEDAEINRPSKFYLSIARTRRPTAGDAAANVMPTLLTNVSLNAQYRGIIVRGVFWPLFE